MNVHETAHVQRRRAEHASNGRSAITIHGGSGASLRHTLLVLLQGRELAEHENPGEATILVLNGRVRVATATAATEAAEGDLLAVPAERHRLEALTDATVLLTVVKLHRSE